MDAITPYFAQNDLACYRDYLLIFCLLSDYEFDFLQFHSLLI